MADIFGALSNIAQMPFKAAGSLSDAYYFGGTDEKKRRREFAEARQKIQDAGGISTEAGRKLLAETINKYRTEGEPFVPEAFKSRLEEARARYYEQPDPIDKFLNPQDYQQQGAVIEPERKGVESWFGGLRAPPTQPMGISTSEGEMDIFQNLMQPTAAPSPSQQGFMRDIQNAKIAIQNGAPIKDVRKRLLETYPFRKGDIDKYLSMATQGQRDVFEALAEGRFGGGKGGRFRGYGATGGW